MNSIFLILLFYLIADLASAVTLEVGSSVGILQQPASNYQHLYSGAYAQIAVDSQIILARGGWLERPQFKSEGYVDQDSGHYFLIGSRLYSGKSIAMKILGGGGQMSGYTRSEDSESIRRGYRMSGLVAAMEFSVELKPLVIAFQHRTFSGYVDKGELDAWVAWPFSFFEINMGWQW